MPQPTTSPLAQKIAAVYIWILALAISSYVVVRAFTVSITHDEVWTILHFAKMSFYDIVTYTDPVPNNHILHTLLVKGTTHLWGMHQVPARLPNVLGFFLYLYATLRFAGRVSDNLLVKVFLVSALLLNVFLLDFFSIARGYGLSIDLMLLSCWFAYGWMGKQNGFLLAAAMATAVLGVYANFTILNFFVPFILLIGMYILLRPSPAAKKAGQAGIVFISVAVLAAISYLPIQKMRATDQFHYWGTEGFYKETLTPVADMSLGHGIGIDVNTVNGIILFVVAVMLAAFAVNQVKRRGSELLRPANFFLLLLLGSVMTPVLQFHLVGTPYLGARTAIWYYPLFVLAVAFYGALLAKRQRIVSGILAGTATCMALFLFAKNANTRTVKEWWFDTNTREVIRYLKSRYEADPLKRPITIDCTWYVNPGFDFYIRTDSLPWLKLVEYHKEPKPESGADYYYTMGDERDLLKDRFTPVITFPNSDRTLFRRKDLPAQ